VATATATSAAVAQTRVTVEGRVVEQGTSRPIANAAVELEGQPFVATSADGSFRIQNVEPGGYALRTVAFGYAPRDLFIVIRRDTTLLVELEIAPIRLDTVAVEGRDVDVRGEIREKGRDFTVTRAEVLLLRERTQTNGAGRFRLRDVPEGVPVEIAVRAFGYFPLSAIITPRRDTMFVFELEPDSLVQRMIDVEVERLKERSHPHLSVLVRPIDREELLNRRNWTALDLVRTEYSINLNRLRCILIDDVQNYNGLEYLVHLYPDELERIEVLFSGAMLRIYTREYIKRMLGGGIELVRPVMTPFGRPPLCR
jgi:hypothetical protein